MARYVPTTPSYAWPLLAGATGAELWVKHENHTPTGAFKVRGGVHFLSRLIAERGRPAGIVSASRGNHSQSLAYAGRAFGVPVTIVVPEGNSPTRTRRRRRSAPRWSCHGYDFQAAVEHSVQLGRSATSWPYRRSTRGSWRVSPRTRRSCTSRCRDSRRCTCRSAWAAGSRRTSRYGTCSGSTARSSASSRSRHRRTPCRTRRDRWCRRDRRTRSSTASRVACPTRVLWRTSSRVLPDRTDQRG